MVDLTGRLSLHTTTPEYDAIMQRAATSQLLLLSRNCKNGIREQEIRDIAQIANHSWTISLAESNFTPEDLDSLQAFRVD